MRRSGIRIAIDDFGTGYSTLSYLCELPVDEVKLDRRLVVQILDDARVATVVRAVITLAHELGLIVVAEGVEDAEIATCLIEFGCDVVQGFYFSVPLSAEQVLLLAAEHERQVPGMGSDPMSGNAVTLGTHRARSGRDL